MWFIDTTTVLWSVWKQLLCNYSSARLDWPTNSPHHRPRIPIREGNIQSQFKSIADNNPWRKAEETTSHMHMRRYSDHEQSRPADQQMEIMHAEPTLRTTSHIAILTVSQYCVTTLYFPPYSSCWSFSRPSREVI
jgi:hypothetical protein